MPTSNSRLAYLDCFDLLDRALDDASGVRVKVDEHRDAIALRTRLHTARRIIRDENTLTYERGDPMWGRSVYDTLTVRFRTINDDLYVYIEKIKLHNNVEALSEVESLLLEKPEPMKLIEGPGIKRRA